MQRFWEKVIYPIIEEYKPKHIVEVGAQYGKNTVKIAQYCKTHDCKISCIDPFPMFDFKSIEKDLGDKFTMYEDLSLNVLGKLSDVDLVLIDGDHNWYTVFNELKLIYKKQKEKFPLIFFHDIGWPYGRRDLYYNVENIAPNFLNPYKKAGIVYGQTQLVDDDGINAHLDNAIYENDNKNGVLTAIEDFIEETPLDLEFVEFQGLNGLGILALKGSPVSILMKDKKFILDTLKLTEEDRLDKELNIVRLKKNQKVLDEVISKKEAEKDALKQKLQDSIEKFNIKEKDINDLIQQNKKLSEEIKVLNKELLKNKTDIDELEKKLKLSQQEIEKSHKLINLKDRKISELTQESISLSSKLKELENELNQKIEEKEDLEEQLQIVKQKLQDSIEKFNIKEKDINNLTQQNKKLSEEIKVLNKELLKNKTDIDELQKKLKLSQQEIEKSYKLINLKDKKISELTQESIKSKETIKKLKLFQDTYFKHKTDSSLYGLRKSFNRLKSYIKLFLKFCFFSLTFNFSKAKYMLKLILNLGKIEKSNLWDEEYYLYNNPDILIKDSIDPLYHYVFYGAFENRDPSKEFSSKSYLVNNPDVYESGLNPLLHYILYGKSEWRVIKSDEKQEDILSQTNTNKENQKIENNIAKLEAQTIKFDKTVDIILPVYNALDDVKNCINSLYDLKTYPFNLIVIDDCSDTETEQYLIEQSKIKNFKLIRNQENLRFTKTVNKGLAESNGDYVVLLNSDTIVTSRWIEKILTCFSSDDKIGIVGPLSNAASWQTVPVRMDKVNGGWLVNEIPDGYSIEEMGMLVETISHKKYPKVPSVNGFCYVIKREVVEKNGFLDEEYFPTGYGEEDDFSIRARDAGYEIAVADDTYIYHAKSKSYTHEVRKVLTHGGRKSLDKKHGKDRIEKLIADWKAEPELLKIGKHIESYMQISTKNKKVVYTAIFGNYDSIKEPEYVNDDWDYICYTDNKNLTSDVFTVKYVEPVFENKTKNARMIKLLSHIFLIDYDYSLWIDGSVKIRGRNINELIEKHKDDYIALHKHIKRDCVYDELKACLGLKKDNSEIMNYQIKTYKKEGLPENCGVAETAEILRKQRDKNTKRLNTLWWNELNKYSIRDQLSFPYVIWKNNFRYGVMEKNQWLDAYFNMYKHNNTIDKVSKIDDPYVSIVVCIEETKIDIVEQFISNLMQMTDYNNYEVLVSALNSNENLKVDLSRLEDKYDKCKVLDIPHDISDTEVRNYIVSKYAKEYVCFVQDSIEFIESNWLRLLVDDILTSKCTAIVGPAILDSKYNILSAGKRVKLKNHTLFDIINYNSLHGTGFRHALDDVCFLVDKENLIKVGMFDKKLDFTSSVIDLCFKLLELDLASKFILNSQVINHKLVSSKGIKKELSTLKNRWKTSDIFQKNITSLNCSNE